MFSVGQFMQLSLVIFGVYVLILRHGNADSGLLLVSHDWIASVQLWTISTGIPNCKL